MEAATTTTTSLGSRPPLDEPSSASEFTLMKEWNNNNSSCSIKASRRISRENTTMSRRFSGSYIRSFREEDNARSFRSNFTISSTASSPGYHLKDEIDPSTYSFTTALKALQARSGYVWECLSPEGFALNSKWSEAERYICNPLSGEFPVECLSSKAVSGRSNNNLHRLIAGRVTMSAPLVYSSNHPSRRFIHPPKLPLAVKEEEDDKENHLKAHIPIIQGGKEKNVDRCKTRDVGIQSTPPDYSPASSIITSSSCPVSPVHMNEDASSKTKCCTEPSSNLNSTEEAIEAVKGTTTDANYREDIKRNPTDEQHHIIIEDSNNEMLRKKEAIKTNLDDRQKPLCRQSCGCSLFSWRSLWMRKRRREKHISAHQSNLVTVITLHP